MAMIERIYNVPLRKEWLKAPKYKRAKRAVTALRAFAAKHMKVDLDSVKIGKYVNFLIWKRGIQSPPHHVKVNMQKTDEKKVFVELFDAPKEQPKLDKKDSKKADAEREKKKEEIKKQLEEAKQKKAEAKKAEVKKEEKKPEVKPAVKK